MKLINYLINVKQFLFRFNLHNSTFGDFHIITVDGELHALTQPLNVYNPLAMHAWWSYSNT